MSHAPALPPIWQHGQVVRYDHFDNLIRLAEAEVGRLTHENDRLRAVVTSLQSQLNGEQEGLRCGCCKSWMPPERFVMDRTRKTGRRSQCRACDAAKRAA